MKFFYNFCLKDDDADLASDILAGVRKGYFSNFQKIRDRITINSDGDSVSYEYAIERDKPMSWEVRSQDRKVLQDVALADKGMYYICFYRGDALYKRALFSRLHTLLKVEYFDIPTGQQMISLEPRKAQNSLCIVYDSRVTAQPIPLFPMPEISDPRVRAGVEESFADYTVSASTDEGIVRFLSAEQERTLRTFIACTERLLGSEPEESFVEETPLYDRIKAKDFNVRRNLSTSLDITDAAEFRYVREESAAEEDDAEACAVAEAAAAAISEALGNSAEPEALDEANAPGDAAAVSAQQPDKMIVADGAMYSYYGGLDHSGNRSGYGRTVTEDGRTAYEGSYLNDKRSGIGSYYYKDGTLCYTGDWIENARHGVGVGVSSQDGSIHAGRWALNKPEGSGVRLGADGDIRFVCKELSDGTTVLMNFAPDDTVVVAKYDAKGKKLGENTVSLKKLLK